MAGSCSSNSIPSLGTSMCRECGPKKKQKQTNKQTKGSKDYLLPRARRGHRGTDRQTDQQGPRCRDPGLLDLSSVTSSPDTTAYRLSLSPSVPACFPQRLLVYNPLCSHASSGEPAPHRCGKHRHAVLSQILFGVSGSKEHFFICFYQFHSSGRPGSFLSPQPGLRTLYTAPPLHTHTHTKDLSNYV